MATAASLTKEQCFGSQIWRTDFVKNPGFCCFPGLGSNFGVGLSSLLPPLTLSFHLGAYCGGSQLMLHPERERGEQKSSSMFSFVIETEKQTQNDLHFVSLQTPLVTDSPTMDSSLLTGNRSFRAILPLTWENKFLNSSALLPHLSASRSSTLIFLLPLCSPLPLLLLI